MNILVVGAGVGGKLSSIAIKNNFPDYNVTLIGPKSNNPEGLFYFNKEIPGVTKRRVSVEYKCLGDINDESFNRYQLKSRGVLNSNIKVSSFDKIGTSESGFLVTDSCFDLSGVNVIEDSVSIIGRKEILTASGRSFEYDKIILTIPVSDIIKMLGQKDLLNFLKYQPVFVNIAKTKDYCPEKVTKIFVYYDLTMSPYYRHSSYEDDTGEVKKLSSESIDESVNNKNTVILYPGKIVPSLDVSKFVLDMENLYNMRILGRYARWDYHYTVDQTYYDTIDYLKN